MVSQKIVINNQSGLHARPASILAQAAGKCKSNVLIKTGTKTIVAKSILNIMAAAIKCGTEIELCCDGESEQEDLNKLIQLIESGVV